MKGVLYFHDKHGSNRQKDMHLIKMTSNIYICSKKKFFSSGSNRYRLTYIKMFVLTSSLRKPMLTSWHFGAGGDILGQKHAFLTKKYEKLELYYKTVETHQRVVISRGSHRNVS